MLISSGTATQPLTKPEQPDRDQVVQGEHAGRALFVGHRQDRLGRGTPSGDVEPIGGKDEQNGLRIAQQHSAAGAVPSLLDLRDVGAAADRGEPSVTAFQQVRRGELSADEVVDGHGAGVVVGRVAFGETTGMSNCRASSPSRLSEVGARITPRNPQLLVQAEGSPLAAGVVGAIREQYQAAGRDATSSTPRAMSLENGLAMSMTTRPIEALRPARSCRPTRCAPSRACRSPPGPGEGVGATSSGLLSTLQMVPTETWASAETSFMPTDGR
ncbi:MAG TPA: hypothetical protein VIU11_14145 [Nakamurella sp.]